LTQTDTNTGIVIDQDYTTINIDSSGTASTIATIDIQAATAVTVSGDAALTITASDLSAVETVTITNSAGVSIDNINADTVYTGGAGDDAVTLANATSVAIDMGAGDDTVTYGGATSTTAGAVGTVTGGDGDDTIVMTSDQAEAADDDAAFNTAFSSFEVLKLSDALDAGETLDLDGLNGVASVVLAAGGDNASTSVIDNLSNNGSVEIQAASTGVVVQIDGAAFNATDSLGVTLTNSSNALVAFGTVTAASTETINITTNDTGTGADAAATIDTAILVATGAKTVTVSGNNGLDLTNTGNTAITTFDASGVVGDSAATVDTAANLAVKFASANTTATATVNITGGAGEDELDGNAAKDVISGGDGADTINGSTGQDTLTGGAGADVFEFMSLQGTSSDSTVAAPDVITDYALSTVATAGDMLNIDIDTAGPVDESADIVGDTTGAGQAAGVNYEVADGILTLSGAGAAAVDTLSEWLTEAAAVASSDGDMLAFEFGTDTYIFAQNGAQDMVIELDGVTDVAALVEGVAATVDNTILITDVA